MWCRISSPIFRVLNEGILFNHPLKCIGGGTIELQQVRGRKRNLKAPMTRAQKLEKRLKREAKIEAKKRYNFMQRIIMSKKKSLYVFILFLNSKYEFTWITHFSENLGKFQNSSKNTIFRMNN